MDSRPFIGGSDAAAIVGVNPYKRPIDVWLRLTGQEPARETNLAMRIGILAEPMLSTLYEERTGERLEPAPVLIDRQYGFIGGSPDRQVVGRRKKAELKTANIHTADRWGEEGTDEVPEEYLCQVAWYSRLSDDESGDLAVLLGGSDFRVYHIHRDRGLEDMLLDASLKFYRDYVETKTPPPPDGSESMRSYIESKYGTSGPDLAPSSAEADLVAGDYLSARRRREEWETKEDTAKQRLQELIGTSRGIDTSIGRATWSTCKGRATTDWKSAAAEIDKSIIERHTHIGAPYRRFLFKPKEG